MDPFSNSIETDPDIVKGLRIDKNNGYQAKISWEPNNPPSEYVVEWWDVRRESDGKKQRKIKESTFTFQNLILGTSTAVRVAAQNGAGRSEFSSTNIIYAAPKAPEDLIVERDTTYPDPTLLVRFSDPDVEPKSYEIAVTSVLDESEQTATTKACCASITQLRPCHKYEVKVVSLCNDVRSPPCRYAMPILTTPGKVTGVTFEKLTRNSVAVAWDKMLGVQSYEIKWRKASGDMEIADSSDNEFILHNLEFYTTYTVHVLAKNSVGIGHASDRIQFKTDPPQLKPTNLQVTHNAEHPESSLDVTFQEPATNAKAYTVRAVARGGEHEERVTTTHGFSKISGLRSGTQYTIFVYCGEETTAKEEMTASEPIWTYPAIPEGVRSHTASSSSQKVLWKMVTSAELYEIEWREVGGRQTTKETQVTEYSIQNTLRNTTYEVRVRAKNTAGWSPHSEPICFKTVLNPPGKVEVENSKTNPKTSIDVNFTEPTPSASSYKIRIKNVRIGKETMKTVHSHRATIYDLQPGEPYKVFVSSHCNEHDELNSEEVSSNEIWTKLGQIDKPLITMITPKSYKISWNATSGALSYVVQWRIVHREKWEKVSKDITETVLNDLETGNTYEVQVLAKNKSGLGDGSEIATFMTAPDAPRNLRYEILSTTEVKIACDQCSGAETYEFSIVSSDGDGIRFKEISKSAEYTINKPIVNFTVSAIAVNSGGRSVESDVLKFRQVVSYVKQKFHKKAADTIKQKNFIALELHEEASAKKISSEQISISAGETVAIHGALFSGKTALCSNIVQSLKQDELGIYLDFNDYKNMKTKLDFKSMLRALIPDISQQEVDDLLKWMKQNEELALLLVDNVTISPDYSILMCSAETKELPSNQIYNLLKLDRKILPRSRVIYTTTQPDLFTIIKPTKLLKILGLTDDGIGKMNANIGQNYERYQFPHLEEFLLNPGFAEVILRLPSDRKTCDVFSRASVLIEILRRLLNCLRKELRQETLENMVKEMKGVNKMGKDPLELHKVGKIKGKARRVEGNMEQGSVSMAPTTMHELGTMTRRMDCIHLQETYLEAINIGLFMDDNKFEKLFKKGSLGMANTTTTTIAAGLLRDDTFKKAKALFSPAPSFGKAIDVTKKRNTLKLFITKKSGDIKNHVYIDSKLALDWISCCIELGDQGLIAKCTPEIKVKNDISNSALDQLATFLESPLAAHAKTTVSIKSDIQPLKQTQVENAIRQNPRAEEIKLVVYKKTGTLLTRKTTTRTSVMSSQRPGVRSPVPSEIDVEGEDDFFDAANDSEFHEGDQNGDDSDNENDFFKGSRDTLKASDSEEETTTKPGRTQSMKETTEDQGQESGELRRERSPTQ